MAASSRVERRGGRRLHGRSRVGLDDVLTTAQAFNVAGFGKKDAIAVARTSLALLPYSTDKFRP